MTSLFRAEILKLRTNRTSWVLAVAALVVAAGGAAAFAATIASTKSLSPEDNPVRQVLSLAGPAQTFALILGVLAVGNEYRHGTITPALLITPRRTPLLAAKLIVLGVAGMVLGALAFGGAAAITLPVLSARHVHPGLAAHTVAAVIAGGATVTGLSAVLGVGLGIVIRNQVGAIIAALGVLYVLEPLLSVIPSVGSAVARYGFAGLSNGASGTSTGFPSSAHLLGQPAALLCLACCALVVAAAGAVLLRQRDVPA
jgi:ABC-2 type transport system permease protein